MWTAALILSLATLSVTPDTEWSGIDIERQGNQTTITLDGQTYSPDQFLLYIEAAQQRNENKSSLFRLLNITTWTGVVWVTLGFVGQLMFTLRLTIQWLASEKNKKVVIPTIYWWCSIAGASMLMVYFVWRWDIVAILGQTFGWTIYSRNLYLIYCTPETKPTPE